MPGQHFGRQRGIGAAKPLQDLIVILARLLDQPDLREPVPGQGHEPGLAQELRPLGAADPAGQPRPAGRTVQRRAFGIGLGISKLTNARRDAVRQ